MANKFYWDWTASGGQVTLESDKVYSLDSDEIIKQTVGSNLHGKYAYYDHEIELGESAVVDTISIKYSVNNGTWAYVKRHVFLGEFEYTEGRHSKSIINSYSSHSKVTYGSDNDRIKTKDITIPIVSSQSKKGEDWTDDGGNAGEDIFISIDEFEEKLPEHIKFYPDQWWNEPFAKDLVESPNTNKNSSTQHLSALDKVLTGSALVDRLEGTEGLTYGEDYLNAGGGNDICYGHRGQDTLLGGAGDDFLHGNHGKDSLIGGLGNDTIRGGHGKDEMIGGAGADWMWGGVGENVVKAGANDGASDAIYVPVDSVQNTNFWNPGGANRDLIYELDASDKIYLHGTGITDAMLTYADGISDPNGSGNSGVGIYANGTLEALVVGSGLNATQIDALTTGGWYA